MPLRRRRASASLARPQYKEQRTRMDQVTNLKPDDQSQAEWRLRIDLAAAFRLAVAFDWHEAVANHFSLAVSPDGRKFLMNRRWRHFSRIRASDLLPVSYTHLTLPTICSV